MLTEGKDRAFAGEDKDESGEEFCKGSSDGVRVGGFICSAQCEVSTTWHGYSLLALWFAVLDFGLINSSTLDSVGRRVESEMWSGREGKRC